MKGKFTIHRERWMKRINEAESKFKIAQDGIHEVLNYIEDEELDVTIHAKLMDIANKIHQHSG